MPQTGNMSINVIDFSDSNSQFYLKGNYPQPFFFDTFDTIFKPVIWYCELILTTAITAFSEIVKLTTLLLNYYSHLKSDGLAVRLKHT